MRSLSGVVAAGLLVLTVVVVGSAAFAAVQGFPGPGPQSVAVHIGGSVVALVAQRRADRSAATVSVLASSVVLIVTALVLYTQWWM